MGKKDPNKPRGKMTAYAFFVQTCRSEHKKAHPDEQVVFADFSRKCAERWREMSVKEKKIFNDMADRDKLRYNKEMATYVPTAGDGGKRAVKRKKDPNAPKRPQSAFFLFCGDRRGEVKKANPTFAVGDVAKALGKMWSECPADEKAKYDVLAKSAKEKYMDKVAAYKDQQQRELSGAKKPRKESSSSSSSGSDSGSDGDSD